MTPTQTHPDMEALEASLLDIARHFESRGYAHGKHVDKARDARRAAAIIAQARAPAGEPVAGRVTNRKSGDVSLRSEPLADYPFNHERWTWEPLYARPDLSGFREEMARIIDPEAWRIPQTGIYGAEWEALERAPSLAKVADIFDLISGKAVGK